MESGALGRVGVILDVLLHNSERKKALVGGYDPNRQEHLLVLGSCDDELTMHRAVFHGASVVMNGRRHRCTLRGRAASSAAVWPFSDNVFAEKTAADTLIGKAVKVGRPDGCFIAIVIAQSAFDRRWLLACLDGQQSLGSVDPSYTTFTVDAHTTWNLSWVDLDTTAVPRPRPVMEMDGIGEPAGAGQSEEETRDGEVEVIDLTGSVDSPAQSMASPVRYGGIRKRPNPDSEMEQDEGELARPAKKKSRVAPPSPIVLSSEESEQYEEEEMEATDTDAGIVGNAGLVAGPDVKRTARFVNLEANQKVSPLFAKFFNHKECARVDSATELVPEPKIAMMEDAGISGMSRKGPRCCEPAASEDKQTSGSVRERSFGAEINMRCLESSLDQPKGSKEWIDICTSFAIDGAEFGAAGEMTELLISKMESGCTVQDRIRIAYVIDDILKASLAPAPSKPATEDYKSFVGAGLTRIVQALMVDAQGFKKLRKALGIWKEQKLLDEGVINGAKELMKSMGRRLTSRVPTTPWEPYASSPRPSLG